MKRMNPLNIRLLSFILGLGAMIFMTNCAGVINTLDQYSGETLYQTAMESQDNLLDFVPDIQAEVNKHLETEEQQHAFQKFQQDFVSRLIEENPELTQEFYDKMHSGDRRQIHEALEQAGEVVEQELQELTDGKEITPENVVDAVMEKYDVQQKQQF